MNAIPDRKKFKILRKDLLIGLRRARSIDDIIALLERKVREYSL